MGSSKSAAPIINPKYCVYGCNTRIYWNNLTNQYLEAVTKKKHVCPNRSNNNINKSSVTPISTNYNYLSDPTNNNNNKHNYKKSWAPRFNNKQPVDNSLEVLQGSTDAIRKQYEILSDLIKEYNGKTHGSQSHILADNSIQLIVYYEVPEGRRAEIKRAFDNFTQRPEIKVFENQ
ncbi:MAG: hypothetical protein ACTHJ2_08575 [Candidatus Nitrosocosmicus sp.]